MVQGSDEEWRMQYDALDNLRVLNKYHGAVFPVNEFTRFISEQIENLRSNNSRVGLNLAFELLVYPSVS
jgi:hypothetical protein